MKDLGILLKRCLPIVLRIIDFLRGGACLQSFAIL
uniref:Uncharacterized protein n=1 Tax=Anguilla anguilla TaxID=7936 RepID=A0A0E9PM27_ANGAN